MPVKRAIPTEYKSILFRSKLEADWARALDYFGVEWEYEPKGKYFGDIFYCPDFWLPRSSQWVEVKGTPGPYDARKMTALCREIDIRKHVKREWDVPLILCSPNGHACGFGRDVPFTDDFEEMAEKARYIMLPVCNHCDGRWFADLHTDVVDFFTCQCCGRRAEFGVADVEVFPTIEWPLAPKARIEVRISRNGARRAAAMSDGK